MQPDTHTLNTPSATRLTLMAMLVTGAMFMEIMDGTIITTALPAMARSFHTSAEHLSAGISVYLLAMGVFIPASFWVADRLGARTVFALAIASFTVMSALCGMVQGEMPFLLLRVAQGAAGSMMVPVGRLIVMRYTPQEKLMSVMSSLVWPALVAPVIGPPLGGFIIAHATWRWIFYLNIPLGVVGLIAAWLVIPNFQEGEHRPFDWLGFLLCGTGSFALLWGLQCCVDQIAPAAIGMLVAGVVLMAAAIRYFRRARSPMIHLGAYGIKTFRVSVRGGAVVRMALGSAPFLLPLLFQNGFGFDAFHAGMLVLVLFLGNVTMKSCTTWVLRIFGYRNTMIWNGVLGAASMAACASFEPQSPMVLILPILFISGCTRSMQFTALATIAFADVPKAQMADANGLFNLVSQIGGAAGIALGALSIRLGQGIAVWGGLHAPGDGYRIAFVIVSVFMVAGVLDAVLLPQGAGDHFIARVT